MDTVICDISALEFHRTPPPILHGRLPAAALQGPLADLAEASRRANAPDDLKSVNAETLGKLKGLTFPIHVMATSRTVRTSPFLAWHDRGEPLYPHDLMQVGDGLFVTTPMRTLIDLANSRTLMECALILFELCGIYAVTPRTIRTEMALEQLESDHAISPQGSHRLVAYSDVNGNPLGIHSRPAREVAWEPCYRRDGTRSDLWKRPPLLTVDDVLSHACFSRSPQGTRRLQRAAKLVLPGSASPAESLFALMATASRKLGGEGLPAPYLNRLIPLSQSGAKALGQRNCVGDATWHGSGGSLPTCCVEIDGVSFHGSGYADAPDAACGRDDHARANVLRRMGIEVVTLTYSQMANAARWDEAMALIARAIGIRRKVQTAAFLRQRERLRRELFGASRPMRTVGR